MKGYDVFIFFLTFLAGVMAGAFIYFTGFRDIDIRPVRPQQVADFEIVVSSYGGCQMTGRCPSYRLLSDGTYTYVSGGPAAAAKTPRTGQLTDERASAIRTAFVVADIPAYVQPIDPDFCESWVDGIDYEYEVVVGTQRYQMDTCGTSLDVDAELIELLDELMRDLGDTN